MKQLILLLLIIFSAMTTSAQQWGGGIAVRVDSCAKEAIELVNAKKLDKVTGFRVCIFMDNGQSARVNAQNALKEFRKHFSGAEAEVVYENPFFKVYAGRFLSRNEASRLLGRVSVLYPRSVISVETFNINQFKETMTIEDLDLNEAEEFFRNAQDVPEEDEQEVDSPSDIIATV